MYRIKIIQSTLLLLSPFFLFSQKDQGLDCFSILAGKDATSDGSVMLAHNEDDWGDRIVNWYKVTERSHKKTDSVVLKNGASMALPSQTWSYLWLEMPEMEFSDSYMNEWGVTIASDACLSRENDPELTNGGIGYWLRRSMAEQAKSARDAVKIGGRLVDTYGYSSSGRTYCIADATEVWMLSVVKGKHWVAQRVPDDQLAIIPNYYTIGSIQLDDTLNFYGSPDLISYAEEKGWYSPETDSVFNFREAYSDTGTLNNTGNIVRHWSAMNALSGKKYEIDSEFPFSFEPSEKIRLQDLFSVLRNHNEGTEYDGSKGYTKGNPHEFGRAICSQTTQYGFVAQLRQNMPKELAYVMWLSPFRPCVHPFTQWYFGIDEIPEQYRNGTWQEALDNHFETIDNPDEYASGHAFLKYVKEAKAIDSSYHDKIEDISIGLKQIENGLINKQPVIEQRLMDLYEKDREQAVKAISGYVTRGFKTD
ncbi:MAG: C69 family dipeptidase [Bacteroidales bacterium]|nr:C69 family dipeptidase [Bacteroidales bacterium]